MSSRGNGVGVCQYVGKVDYELWNQTDLGSFIHSFLPSFIKYLWSPYCVPVPVPGAGDTTRTKIQVPTNPVLTFLWKKSDDKYTNILGQVVICTTKKKKAE